MLFRSGLVEDNAVDVLLLTQPTGQAVLMNTDGRTDGADEET